MICQITKPYRSYLVPANMPDDQVESAASADVLPSVDMQAPNAEFARKCAQAMGQRVHRVERIVDEVAA